MKHKRTGKDDGLWIKGIGREIKFRYKDQTKSNMKIYGAEIGYDREIWHNGGKGLQLGLYGGTSDSRQKYDRGGHGDGETQSLGVYSTLSTADNWFVDVVGTYFWHTQKIKAIRLRVPMSTASMMQTHGSFRLLSERDGILPKAGLSNHIWD